MKIGIPLCGLLFLLQLQNIYAQNTPGGTARPAATAVTPPVPYTNTTITAIHETLHQYGLSDRYTGKNGLAETPAAYKHDVMGEGNGTVQLSQTHFDNLGSKLLEIRRLKIAIILF